MTFKDLKFKPGVYSDDTARDAGTLGFWKDSDKVRFRHGLPQTIGGWEAVNVATSMQGVARGAVDWVSTRLEQFIAFGTHLKLYVWTGEWFNDITPIRASSTINNNPFATTINLPLVTVTDTTHGANTGAFVTFSGATAAGGITIVGEYQVTVLDADTYTITHSANATSTATGGGANVVAAYQINPGAVDSQVYLGWGAGAWGAEEWGTPRTISSSINHARTWTLETWGEDLIATHYNGNVYLWDSSGGVSTRATLITQAPTNNKAITISQESRHVIALGAGGDPLLIQWCDAEDYTDWTPTETNTAGEWRIDQGNQILRAIKVRDQHLVFTDTTVYTMQYVGPPYVFSIKSAGGKGIMGPNAAIAYLGTGYWMGPSNFYLYDGTVRTIDCPVFNQVFLNVNQQQKHKCWAAVNANYDEVWWLYCSANSTEIDRYVIFNTTEGHWAVGTISRTLLVGDSDVIDYPYAVATDGQMYYHEVGTSAAGAALSAYVESGDVEIDAGGEHFMHVGKFVPDFKTLDGSVTITLSAKRYPQDTASRTSANTVDSSVSFFNPRLRGRQVSLKIASNATDASWRMGVPRLDVKPHGRR